MIDCSVALLDAPTPGPLRRGARRLANAGRRALTQQTGSGWYPGAVHRPVPEASTQGFIVPRLGIVHTNGATGHTPSLYGWILNPASNGMECHIQAALNGTLEQYMPVNRRADCNYKANAFELGGVQYGAVSVETEDLGSATVNTTPLTAAQFEAIAGFFAWLHTEWGVSLDNPTVWNGEGVGYHTQFPYPLWTNVPGKTCPANAKKAQIPALRSRAAELAGVTPPVTVPVFPPPTVHPPVELDMPVRHPIVQQTGKNAIWVTNIVTRRWLPTMLALRQTALELGLIADAEWGITDDALRARVVTPVGSLEGYGAVVGPDPGDV